MPLIVFALCCLMNDRVVSDFQPSSPSLSLFPTIPVELQHCGTVVHEDSFSYLTRHTPFFFNNEISVGSRFIGILIWLQLFYASLTLSSPLFEVHGVLVYLSFFSTNFSLLSLLTIERHRLPLASCCTVNKTVKLIINEMINLSIDDVLLSIPNI